MSSKGSGRRAELLEALQLAGREHSNAAVMFHTALSARMGLNMTEEKTLDVLEREGAQTAGAIARRTGLTPASVTGLLDRLERKGFVRRHRHGDDGRRVLVEINREHVASFGALFADFMAGLDALYATYTEDELAVILDYLQRSARVQHDATTGLTAR